jgi:hypothetical protein
MPLLDTLELKIKTGQRGLGQPPSYAINGHTVEFEEITGGVGPHETVEVSHSPRSFAHSLMLIGPDEGFWDIEQIDATFHIGGNPYAVRLGAVTLDNETKLNLWYDRPPALLDV